MGRDPLSVHWAWPSPLPYEVRHSALRALCGRIARAWAGFGDRGDPIRVGHAFLGLVLPALLVDSIAGPIPRLAGLVAASAFDLALHDAFGVLLGRPTYSTYGPEFLGHDLAAFLEPAEGSGVSFSGLHPPIFSSTPGPRASTPGTSSAARTRSRRRTSSATSRSTATRSCSATGSGRTGWTASR